LAEVYAVKLMLRRRQIHASAQNCHCAKEATPLYMFDQFFPRSRPKGLWSIQLLARDELNRRQRLVADGGATAPAPGERYS
jgi:hypothetical protein